MICRSIKQYLKRCFKLFTPLTYNLNWKSWMDWDKSTKNKTLNVVVWPSLKAGDGAGWKKLTHLPHVTCLNRWNNIADNYIHYQIILDAKTTDMRSCIPTERKGESCVMSLICAADKPTGSGWDWFDIHAVSLPQGECCLSPSYFPSRIHDLLSIKISRVRINLSHRRTRTQTLERQIDRNEKKIIEKGDEE